MPTQPTPLQSSPTSRSLQLLPCAAALLLLLPGAFARAQATGNGTPTEPSFPTSICSTLTAQTTTSNGMTGEPTSETDYTSTIQSALSACSSGKAVELTLGTSGQNAFVTGPIYIPAGVTLLVDAGVTVFASKVGADYQVGTPSSSQDTCGVNGTHGNGCYPLINVGQSSLSGTSSKSNAALMGYGIINGRGYDAPTNSSGTPLLSTCGTGGTSACSWWQLADNARSGGDQNNPTLVYLYKGVNAVLYKITVVNSPMFHVKFSSDGTTTNNFLAWGVKVLTPYTARNTDGIDPGGANGVSISNSIISDGDDEIAISGSSQAQYYTLTNLLLTSGHGISIGSITGSSTNQNAGVTNILVNNVNFSGQYINGVGDGNAEGLRIKSYCSVGGPVTNVTYQNVCMQNLYTAIDVNPYYSSTTSTTTCPAFGTSSFPITYSNVDVLTAMKVNLEGLSNASVTNPSYLTFNNVYFSSLTQSELETPEYDTITLTGTYFPASLQSWLSAGASMSVTNSATVATSAPTSCPSSNFPALIGELSANTTASSVTTNNRNKAFSLPVSGTVTLNAVVEPTVSEVSYTASYTGYTGTNTAAATPSGSVQFYDNGTALGSAVALSQNGTLATTTITPAQGAHLYTFGYTGDGAYPAETFTSTTSSLTGTSLAVSVYGAASQLGFTTAPPTTLTYGTAPGTVVVAVQDSSGDTVATSTASVTLTVTGPNYTHTYTATAAAGVATFSSIAAPNGSVGAYTYTASATSLTSATANEAIKGTLTVQATSTSRAFDTANPTFAYTIGGYVSPDTSSVVGGAPALTTTAVPSSAAGTYPIAAALGTLSATNYTFQFTAGTLTVSGNAPQIVLFQPLPSFPHGGSYQLTASASSGLPVTYTVSGTGASVSGDTLTLSSSAAGQTITVTAAQGGNVSYAAATSVVQSFVAQ